MKLLLFAAALLLLAGCGGNSDSDHEPVTGALVTPAADRALPPGATPEDFNRVHCGVERWAVKTLTDPDAGRVNLEPQTASIDQLRAFPAPSQAQLAQPGRMAPAELQAYTVAADAVSFKQEADGDIHLVIADHTTHHSMVVEFPDAAHCVTAAPELRQRLAAARAAVIALYGQPPSGQAGFKRLRGQVVVTGVAFFDFLHSQNGVAPNGVELHPVLSIASAP